MLGAIAGDIFGAAFEGQPLKKEDFDLFGERRRFTDDTVMTVATAEALLGDGDYAAAYRRWGRRYPGAGYGGMFRHWIGDPERSAAVSHDHPEGIKGAQAAAAAVFFARGGASQAEIRAELAGRFGYRLDRSIAAIRPDYRFDPTCQGSVPEALTAFLEAADFEHAIRLAISLGGDADTQAASASWPGVAPATGQGS